MEKLDKLVTELCKLPNESGWVEFKQNNWSPEMVGRDISALANSAVLSEHDHAYMIWGVDDDTHTITGTDIRLNSLRKGNQELENWLRYLLSQNADFGFLSAEVNGRHVELIVRESIANALVHQDFYITGAGPVVEMFTNRIEVTNPGVPLVDVMRIIDNPPRSRNEKLASLMRRMGMCEELGRGWDRMVISCELQQLPAPQIHAYKESTKVTLFSYLEFTSIPITDKLWSTYLHACVKYLEGHALTNSSLRERFGLAETAAGSISRLIKEALEKDLIKHVNPDTAPRYMKYIPIWG